MCGSLTVLITIFLSASVTNLRKTKIKAVTLYLHQCFAGQMLFELCVCVCVCVSGVEWSGVEWSE